MLYNNADQLAVWPGMHGKVVSGVVTPGYTYYPDGSLYQVLDVNGTVAQRTYTYTDSGLLETATYPGGSASFTWDAAGNRVGLQTDGGSYSFVYDITVGIPAVLEEAGSAGTVSYIREPGGELIARAEGSAIRYYHFDELGSTRLLTDGGGTVVDRYAYDAWSGLLSHDKTADSVDQPYQYVGQLGYYTHYQDPAIGTLLLGIRCYDPDMARFTQPDPAGYLDGPNRFAYSVNSLLSSLDPSGLTCRYGPVLPDDEPGITPLTMLKQRIESAWIQNHPKSVVPGRGHCYCYWEWRTFVIKTWMKMHPKKQYVSCQYWGECNDNGRPGYGPPVRFWIHFSDPEIYDEVAGELPGLSMPHYSNIGGPYYDSESKTWKCGCPRPPALY